MDAIWSRDWDVLVIADACRYDLLESVTDERVWLPDEFESIRSAGSKSPQWMENTFTDEYASEMADTAYITGNPYSRDYSADQFAHFEELWRTHWEDGEISTMPPRPLTDRAIDVWRRHDEFGADRLIVHYMQPHIPFYGYPELYDGYGQEFGRDGVKETQEKNVWYRLRDGEVSHAQLWKAYQDNLRVALDEVEILQQNMDADLVVSSDHGNGMGEWGIYAHPRSIPFAALRRVPWVPLSAQDTGEFTPSVSVDRNESGDVEERLAALGYR